MQRWWILALVPALAGCTAFAGSGDGLDEAGWRIGDHFAYTWQGWSWSNATMWEGNEVAIDVRTPMHVPLLPSHDMRVVNTSFASPHATHNVVDMVSPATGMKKPTLMGIRDHDLQSDRKITSFGRSCPVCSWEATNIRFEPDDDDYSWVKFPLREGSTWSGIVPQVGGGPLAVTSTVGGTETVETAAGAFRAVRVEHKFTDAQEAATWEEFEQEVREIHPDAHVDYEETLIHTVWFSGEAHAVVRELTTGHARVEVTWTDGVPMRYVAEGRFVAKQDLVQRDHTSRDTMDREGMLALEAQRRGQSIAPSKARIGYSVAVFIPGPSFVAPLDVQVADAVRVNASLAVRFDPGDAPGTPGIVVLGPDGAAVQVIKGTSGEVQLPYVGTFVVAAVVVDGQRVSAYGSADVGAWDDGTLSLSCPVVLAANQCPVEVLPVGPYAEALTATVHAAGTSVLAPTFWWLEATGERHEVPLEDGFAFTSDAVAGEWGFGVEDGVALAPDVALSWRLDPAPATWVAPEGGEGTSRAFLRALPVLEDALGIPLPAVPLP